MTVDEVRKLDEVAGLVNDVRVIVARMDAVLTTAVNGHDDHEARLRAIERKVWALAGASAAVGAGGGKLLTLLFGG